MTDRVYGKSAAKRRNSAALAANRLQRLQSTNSAARQAASSGRQENLTRAESERGEGQSAAEVLQRAAAEQSRPMDASLRDSLEGRFAHDFSRIRVHSGTASIAAAEALGARAYALGTDIHLGAEAHGLSRQEYDRLIVHEVIHTVQQGSRTVSPHSALRVSSPADTAEREAVRIADWVVAHDSIQNPSRSLAMRDQMRAAMPGQQIGRSVAPQIQRDLTGKKSVQDGDFDLDLKTQSNPGGTSGIRGTIKFTAGEKAPDSKNIRLLQVVKDEDLTTGKDYVWTGGEANRNKAMTAASKGITGGYFVDASYAGITPRTKKTDAAVSPYYRDYWPNASSSQYGSKSGKTVQEASLWDSPGSAGNRRFSFETAAKAVDTGYIYATLTWGFTISDAARGTVDLEHATANRGPSATFGAAVKSFDEFSKNPGSSTAP